MAYDKFTLLKNTAIPLAYDKSIDNRSTINNRARFFKSHDRGSFGDNLFRDWRFK